MSIILDTSFLVALYNKNDQYHCDAQKLGKRLLSGELGKSYFTDYIFSEVVTLLRARKFPESQIEKAANTLLQDPVITLLHIETTQFQEAWEMFKKHERLSFTDCTTVVLAKAFGIKKIATFDVGFDSVTVLQRLLQ